MIGFVVGLAVGLLPAARYEALEGGRPAAAVPLGAPALGRLVRGIGAGDQAAPSRVWLELANGESLVVSFEPSSAAEAGCVIMRVRQTRVAGECSLDNPAGCVDAGCVAVQWDLQTREGVLLDLFKAKAGDRRGCDLSSADDAGVRWGGLMLGVVDDVARALGVRHVLVADESSVRLRAWAGATEPGVGTDHGESCVSEHQVQLQYLAPLLHGRGYYESHGFYEVPHEQARSALT